MATSKPLAIISSAPIAAPGQYTHHVPVPISTRTFSLSTCENTIEKEKIINKVVNNFFIILNLKVTFLDQKDIQASLSY